MQEKYKYFMTDEDYKKFQECISAEREKYNHGVYRFERAMQNITATFTELCYTENKSWAVMLAEIAEETELNGLLRICNMRVVFDKPKTKC